MLLEVGKYVATLSGPSEGTKSGIIVYETNAGALCAAMPVKVAEGPNAGKELKSTQTLVKRDGTVQTRTTDNLKAIFGWPGDDPFWLMDNDLSAIKFEIVVEAEAAVGDDGGVKTDDQGQAIYYSKVAWINPLGAGVKMPEPADRRSVLAKYGSKFRALSGGVPVKSTTTPPIPKPSPLPPPKKTPPPAAQPTLSLEPKATMEEAWAELCNANQDGKTQEQLSEIWYRTIGTLFPGKTNSDLTPQEWAKLKSCWEDNVPM